MDAFSIVIWIMFPVGITVLLFVVDLVRSVDEIDAKLDELLSLAEGHEDDEGGEYCKEWSVENETTNELHNNQNCICCTPSRRLRDWGHEPTDES